MEVCGGQTHSIMRHGIDKLLPPRITLVHGPGCPVCVTPQETLNWALAVAARPEVIFISFFFFKQKTAYEISECDWSSTCALPSEEVFERLCKKVKSLGMNFIVRLHCLSFHA